MSGQKTHKRWLMPAAKVLIFGLLVWALRASLLKFKYDLEQHTWTVSVPWLVLAGVLYVLGTVPWAVYWQRLLIGAGQPVGLGESLRAYYVSQLGKYVPGKAMVLVIRAGLLQREHVETSVVAASVFCEALATMAVGSLLAALLLAVWHTSQRIVILAGLGMFVVTALPIVPPVLRLLVRGLHVVKINLAAVTKLSHQPASAYALGWTSLAMGWVLQGVSLWATLVALGATHDGPISNLPLHTAAVALAVVAGFLALIPGGLGVRELVLIPLLAPVYGEDNAVVCAIIWRLVGLVSEVVVSAVLYPLGPRLSAPPKVALESPET